MKYFFENGLGVMAAYDVVREKLLQEDIQQIAG